jgi:hypothetical protein
MGVDRMDAKEVQLKEKLEFQLMQEVPSIGATHPCLAIAIAKVPPTLALRCRHTC